MSGANRIAAERQRQIDVEGWTPEHDAEHASGELLRAAESYIWAVFAERIGVSTDRAPSNWPWSASWWKPSHDPVRNLVKAGALIAAEIDRLEATSAATPNPPDAPATEGWTR